MYDHEWLVGSRQGCSIQMSPPDTIVLRSLWPSPLSSLFLMVIILVCLDHPPKAYEEGAENRIIDSISDVLIENPEILSAEAGDCDLPALIRSMRTTEICPARQNGKCADGKG